MEEKQEPADRTTHERIMDIAKDNTLAAIILTGTEADKLPRILGALEQFQFSREMVNCTWLHVANRNRAAFNNYITSLTERPLGCPNGCIWLPIAKDESRIFGKQAKPSFHDCAMAECDVSSNYYCGRCYCVRYCGPLHQRLDWPRHKSECDAVIDSVRMLKPYGEPYAKRAIKNHISISDECFTRLWKKQIELLAAAN